MIAYVVRERPLIRMAEYQLACLTTKAKVMLRFQALVTEWMINFKLSKAKIYMKDRYKSLLICMAKVL